MNPDADDITRLNDTRIHLLEGFVCNDGIIELTRSGGGHDMEPPGRDNRDAKGYITGVD